MFQNDPTILILLHMKYQPDYILALWDINLWKSQWFALLALLNIASSYELIAYNELV